MPLPVVRREESCVSMSIVRARTAGFSSRLSTPARASTSIGDASSSFGWREVAAGCTVLAGAPLELLFVGLPFARLRLVPPSTMSFAFNTAVRMSGAGDANVFGDGAGDTTVVGDGAGDATVFGDGAGDASVFDAGAAATNGWSAGVGV